MLLVDDGDEMAIPLLGGRIILNQGVNRRQRRRPASSPVRLEQILELPRLAAQVLAGAANLRAKVRRGMPGPARIVEHGPRQRDQIGVARGENGLRLVEVGDEADGDHGNLDRPLDFSRQRNLIARP